MPLAYRFSWKRAIRNSRGSGKIRGDCRQLKFHTKIRTIDEHCVPRSMFGWTTSENAMHLYFRPVDSHALWSQLRHVADDDAPLDDVPYDCVPDDSVSNSNSSKTSSYANSLHPLKYWRVNAGLTAKVLQYSGYKKNARATIEVAIYWKKEAKFFALKVSQYHDYEKNASTTISDAIYWKQKAEFLASKTAESLGRDPSELRLEIKNPEYWHQENVHYNDLLDALPTRDHDIFHPANSLPTEKHNHTISPVEALVQAPQDNHSSDFVEALSPHNSAQAQSKYHVTDLIEAQLIHTSDRDACSARSSTQSPRRSNRLKELVARNCRILKQGQSTSHTAGLSIEKRPRRSTRLKELTTKKRRGGKFAESWRHVTRNGLKRRRWAQKSDTVSWSRKSIYEITLWKTCLHDCLYPNLRNIIVMLEVVLLDVWKIQHAASIKRDCLIEPVYEPN